MATITKLDVGKALDKLRDNNASKSRTTQLDEKIAALEKETQRLKLANSRLERSQRPVKRD